MMSVKPQLVDDFAHRVVDTKHLNAIWPRLAHVINFIKCKMWQICQQIFFCGVGLLNP